MTLRKENMASGLEQTGFLREKHIKYFKRCLQILPNRYASLDTSRMTVAFFAISGLDMLDALNVLDGQREGIIEWIHLLQVLPDKTGANLSQCGFRGSSTLGAPADPLKARLDPIPYDSGHVAMTYTALLTLLILGDDLSRIDRRGLVAGLRQCQLPDGSFCPTPEGSENDMRFVYCACCISYVLDDWSGMDVDRVVGYITSSLSYEGGFGQGPGLEAHGGSTYCAVASLVLLGRLEAVLTVRQLEYLCRWCVLRQQSGFQGRPNKPVDTCYSFWVGATLKLLGIFDLSDAKCNHSYLMDTQDSLTGGFSKWPDNTPDALHAYFGVCGLSLLGQPGLKTMHAALNISQSAADHLTHLQQQWRLSQQLTNQSLGGGDENSSDAKRLTNDVQVEDGARANHKNDCIELTNDGAAVPFVRDQHVKFLLQCLKGVPAQHEAADTSRMTLAFFSLSALDLMGELDRLESQNRQIRDWIYSLQITSIDSRTKPICGFRGSCNAKVKSEVTNSCNTVDSAHVVMTYSALCSLLVLGDDLSRLDRAGILRSLGSLQAPNGSFRASPGGVQTDMKFTYCAVCVCHMLGDWAAVDVRKILSYITDSLTYEGGFGQGPGLEAHGGATFCAVASLSVLGALRSTLGEQRLDAIKRWCLSRQQTEGFSGRTNKDPDASYSFWISATLQLLGALESSDLEALKRFVLSTQAVAGGGFASLAGRAPDPMNTYFSVCTLSLLQHPDVRPLNTALNISQSASAALTTARKTWGVGGAKE